MGTRIASDGHPVAIQWPSSGHPAAIRQPEPRITRRVLLPKEPHVKLDEQPLLAIWEITRARDLASTHSARPTGELNTDEGRHLLDGLAAAKVPLVVLTGRDPAERPDLPALVRHGASRGLSMGLTPATTPLATPGLIRALAKAGLARLAIGIQAPDAETHEALSGAPGSYPMALRILEEANAAGIRTQVNTTAHARNIHQLGEMVNVVKRTKSVLWSVFYVVPTGRAEARQLPTAREVEASLNQLADIAASAPFSINTTAAPHYRRVLLQRKRSGQPAAVHGLHGPSAMRVNDGRGLLFVSHRGAIHPSGFLPIPCGNVRTDSVIDVYRSHPTFVALRNPDRVSGKCGVCEYRAVCGGSRARAFAITGDPLRSDVLCEYVPAGYRGPLDIFTAEDRRRVLPVLQER